MRAPTRGSRSCAGAVAALALSLAAAPAAAACPSGLSSQLIPLPIYATLPNEGNTWGVMPVVLRVCRDDQRTESIFAPSLSWNSVIQYTGTFRWFHYPTEETALTVVSSWSTRTNYNNLLMWERHPAAPGEWSDDLLLRAQRNAFERFFGIGPRTPADAETSFTSLRLVLNARRGLNVAPHLNLGASAGIEHDEVEAIAVPGLPLSQETFPATPGMRGATLATQGIDLRWDDRTGGDYAERGFRADAGVSFVEGLRRSPAFWRGNLQLRGIVQELPWLSGAARLAWTGVTSPRAPFQQQSSLGGSFLLRGFTDRRFVDRQAWTLELEQRIRVLRTRIFGVVADWRADPFVAVGQVFDHVSDAVARPRVAVGVGFRAFARPNVLGRVDVAWAGEGAKVYVELGYPY